jgi:hypothetical protein
MPIIVSFSFVVEPYLAGSLLRHRLTWVFVDGDGNQYPGTQDRPPASNAEHEAWLQGQADQFSAVTTEAETESP